MKRFLAGRMLWAAFFAVVAGGATLLSMNGVGTAGAGKGNNGKGVQEIPDAEDPAVCGTVDASAVVSNIQVGTGVETPFGSDGDRVIVRDITFGPNTILDWHYHPGPGFFEVTAGSARYETSFGIWDLASGAIVTEPPYQVHRLLAGPSGVTIRYSAITRVGFPSTRCVGNEPDNLHGLEAQGPIRQNLLYPSRNDAGVLQLLPTP